MGTRQNRQDAKDMLLRFFAFVGLACGLLTAAPAHAKGVADTVTVLPPIRVDGSRIPIDQRQTGTQVLLDRARIARFLPATATDALISVPGVDLVKTGPWASRVSMRGLSGDRVLVMVDGVRLNTVRGHGAQASLVSVDQLDAVEVMPGAGSAQYGSDALGGVVNFVTHHSLIEPVARQSLMIAGHTSDPGGTWSQTARWRFTGPRLGVELSGGSGAQQFLKTPNERVANSGSRDQNLGGRVTLRLGTATFDYERSQQRAFDIGLPAFGNRAGSRGVYPLQQRDLDRIEVVQPGWARFAPEARVLVVGQSFVTDFDELVVDTVAVGRNRVIKSTDSRDHVTTTTWGVQPSLRFSNLAGLRLAGEWRHERANGPRAIQGWTTTVAGAPWGTPTSGAATPVPPAWRDVWSGSASIAPRFGPAQRVHLEAGLRHDQQQSHADGHFSTLDPTQFKAASDLEDRRTSAESGLSVDLGHVEPYAHVSSGFRAPNLDERYYEGYIHGELFVIGNGDLRSERNVTNELGLKLRDCGPLSNARFSVYRSEVHDLIQLTPGTLYQGVMRFGYENVRRARIEGVEGTAQLRVRSTTLGLSGTLPRAYEYVNVVKQGLTTDAGTARASVELTTPMLNMMPQGLLSVRWRWNDAFQPRDPNLWRPSFQTTTIEVSTVLSGLRTVFTVKNVFDRAYFEPLSFIPESGRTFSVSIRREFGLPASLGNAKKDH